MAAQKDHGLLQAKVDEMEKEQEGETERPEERGRGDEHSRHQVKPIKELEPSLVANFKLSGTDLEMTIRATASGFQKCDPVVKTVEGVQGSRDRGHGK